MTHFIDLITGNFQPVELRIWIIIQGSLFVLFIFLAYRFHIKNNPYSIMKHTMSFLGSHLSRRNPKGWYFFSIGMIITGSMFIPLIQYYHKRIIAISIWGAWLGTILQLLGAIGVILVALIPDNEEEESFIKGLKSGAIHNVVAGIAFLGLGIGNLWYGGLILYDALFGNQLFDTIKLLPPYIILALIMITIIILQLKWAKICKEDNTKELFPGEGIYSFPLWEWILIFYLFAMLYYILLNLPYIIP